MWGGPKGLAGLAVVGFNVRWLAGGIVMSHRVLNLSQAPMEQPGLG